MTSSIFLDTHMCTTSNVNGINEEKETCLQNMEYTSYHRVERINMLVKCIVHMHITAKLKAYWLLISFSFSNNPATVCHVSIYMK